MAFRFDGNRVEERHLFIETRLEKGPGFHSALHAGLINACREGHIVFRHFHRRGGAKGHRNPIVTPSLQHGFVQLDLEPEIKRRDSDIPVRGRRRPRGNIKNESPLGFEF